MTSPWYTHSLHLLEGFVHHHMATNWSHMTSHKMKVRQQLDGPVEGSLFSYTTAVQLKARQQLGSHHVGTTKQITDLAVEDVGTSTLRGPNFVIRPPLNSNICGSFIISPGIQKPTNQPLLYTSHS